MPASVPWVLLPARSQAWSGETLLGVHPRLHHVRTAAPQPRRQPRAGRQPGPSAAADLVERVAAAGDAWRVDGGTGPATVGVFLDGENPWERYVNSGHDFLEALHRALESDPRIETVTMSEAVAEAAHAVHGAAIHM